MAIPIIQTIGSLTAGAPTPPQRTTLKQDPCPNCRCQEGLIVLGRKICAQCGLGPQAAQLVVKSTAQRDVNGSLLCQGCGEPYPYAEPKSDGTFVCTPCCMRANL